MLRILPILGLLAAFTVGTANAQFDFETFLRIDGQDSISDTGMDQVITLDSGTYTAELFLRDDGDSLLRDAFDNGVNNNDILDPQQASGLVGVNMTIDLSGPLTGLTNNGSSQSTDGSAGNAFLGFSVFGPDVAQRGDGGFETLVGSFDFTFDGIGPGVITTANGPPNGAAIVNSIQGERGGNSIAVDSLIDFRSATIVGTTAVPEPGSFLVLSIGLAGAATRRRRR
tara:strand:- start:237145 stop:237825 length:681 start_codon:yes stop_codon:yes gene_type:complete